MNYSPAKTLILFFLALITAGTALLLLPVSRNPGFDFSVLTCLFTSVSAVSVTGLSVVSIGEYFSLFGQIVILFLMQIGGLGYMFVSTAATLLIGKMALKDRRMMQEIFDISSFSDLKRLLYKAMFFIFAIEFAGTVILTAFFAGHFSFLKSFYLGIFHSVSAFCSGGFSLFSDSLTGYASSPVLLYTMSLLMLLGGLGFFVIVDLYDTYKYKRLHLSTNTKVILLVYASIIVFGFVFFFLSEKMYVSGLLNNTGIFEAVNNSLFQAISACTAGFNSVPTEQFNDFTKAVLSFLMSIGAAPGSTAGGLKVTTLALVFVFVRSTIESQEDYVIFKRRIPWDLVKKALAIFIIYFAAMALFSAALVMIETSAAHAIDVVFEAVSAFGTLGLSAGITPMLSSLGKIIVIAAMVIGRIGILTVLILMATSAVGKKNIKYPEARILVG
ncbi:MAG: hypothetical protein LBR69_06525 [Endomicrobium sp.]|jgi:trk system potassium uptake protein TrkH|nr:hypothetical protein [Endomicrobium sp.]